MLKDLREQSGLPQRKVAAMLDIDTATYCKIERGAMSLKREHIPILAELWNVEEEILLKQWLAEKVASLIEIEDSIAADVLAMAQEIVSNHR